MMPVEMAGTKGATAGSARAAHLLDLLDDAASGRGSIHFIGDERDPTPIAELWRATEQSARWFAANVGAGATVAMVLANTRSCVTALFGAWRAACTVASLPLPARGMSAHIYGEQLARFCMVAGAATLMLDSALAPQFSPAGVSVYAYDETLSGGASRVVVGDGALVQFTSGSVGTPKGIYLSLEAVGSHVAAIISALDPGAGDASCSWLPLSHDMGLIGQLLSPLAAGAPRHGHHSLTLMKPQAFMSNPRSWLRTCSDKRATISVAPNFALDLAVRANRQGSDLDLSPLRSIIVGSESVRDETLTRFADTFARAGFRSIAFCPAYGLAEATLAVTIVRPHEMWRSIPRPASAALPDVSSQLVSTGSPLEGTAVRIAGPAGSVAAIEISSPSLLSRYLGADLRLTPDGYFVTGDVGLVHSGELYVVGRGDEVIVVSGTNVYPNDIEAEVKHPSIRRGCIAAVAAPDGGLAIVVEPNGRPSDDELRAACREIRRAVVTQTGCSPSTVAFVARGGLPKTPSGKVKRLAIGAILVANDELLARVDF
jgi:acyl-CoA synthetase (AMP-forming)/AMP-acid ligase II